MELFSLRGKVALITGGLGDIGRTLARGFAEAGADLALLDRSLLRQAEVEAEVRAAGRRCVTLEADVRVKLQVDAAFQQTLDRLGRLDIAVNNAGLNIRGPAEELAEADLGTILDVNLKGVFLCGQAAARIMKTRGGGKIINIASIAGTVGLPGSAAYCGSKGGVVLLTRAWAAEWASFNIQVNAIGPTYIRTQLNAAFVDRPEIRERILRFTPAGRLGRCEDLVGTAIYLGSAASDLVTGQTIFVDGGYTAV
ncbi:MAG TPA: SDR family oxidoreductase [Candidatus Methylomirabilis sp.]|nr:SDR family oxidoreductase [Candidatus Methylomirabilis sp.]